jgi:alpha-L-fucosidase
MKAMILLACAFAVSGALAGEAKVTLVAPENFADIVIGDESPRDGEVVVRKEFEQIFNRLARKLPDGYVFEVTVTDIDLAGAFRGNIFPNALTATRNFRIVRRLDWPRVQFSYTIKNPEQNTVASGTENLRDLDFIDRIKTNTSNSQFRFEEEMLKDWFKQQSAVQEISLNQKK